MQQIAELEKEEINVHFSLDEISDLLAILRESNNSILEKKLVQQLANQQYFDLTEDTPMTYSSFKDLKMVEEISPITLGEKDLKPIKTQITGKNWLTDTSPKKPSQWLIDTLAINKKTPLMSKKSRSEGLIRPILLDLLGEHTNKFTLFSGETFNVNADFGLTGECDFLLSLSQETDFIQNPVFALVEAKKKSIEEGLGQCAAQMIAAREFNQDKGKDIPIIYGAVSTGEVWKFLKLENETLIIDKEKYYEKFELEKILGILQHFVDFYKKEKEV